MKIILTFLTMLTLAASAQELTPGITFLDGQRLTAAQLQQLVAQAIINPAFYTDKINQTNVNPTDIILIYSPASGTFHKVTGSAALFNNVALIANQPVYTQIAGSYFYFLGYDPTNNILFQINNTNLLNGSAPYLNVSLLDFSNALPSVVTIDPLNQSNAIQELEWGSNGVPFSITESNKMRSLAGANGTNFNVPWTFAQMFLPWSFYGTNTAGTNAWGYATNFPITSLFFNGVTAQTLNDSDTFPVNSSAQNTNTTATFGALYSYLTNKNILPAYTQAREIFSGIPVQVGISNNANTTYGSISLTNAGFSALQIYAGDFITNNAGTFPFPGVQTNQIYYLAPFATNANWVRVFTNYSQAAAGTNWITLTSQGSGANSFVYVTNYTSFNADVIPVVAGTSIVTGYYDFIFRSASQTPYYYITGSSQGAYVTISGTPYPTLFKARIAVSQNGTPTAEPLVHVLINPQ